MNAFSLAATISRCFRGLARDRRGGTFVLTAVATPVVLGGLTLAVDTGHIYLSQRKVQQQADAAAAGTAIARGNGARDLAVLKAVAGRDAARNGYVEQAGSSLTVNVPPTSGSHTGSTTAVEVIIEATADTFFARYFNIFSVTVRGRAVVGYGGEGSAGGGGCVLALSGTAARALRFQGSGTIQAPTCTMVSNSNAADAVYVGGSGKLVALGVYAVGGMERGPSVTMQLTQEPQVNTGAKVTDPYARTNIEVSAADPCSHTGYSVSGSQDKYARPGIYCDGLEIGGSGTQYLLPGTYVVRGGDFKVTGSAKVRCSLTSGTYTPCGTGDGITILLVAGSSGTVGTVSIAGTTDVQFTAPSVDTFYNGTNLRGIAVYQDRNAALGNAANLTGSSAMKISGAIYLPSAQINYSGTADLPEGKKCVLVIGHVVEIQGNSRLNISDCPSMGVQAIDANGGRLVMLE